MNSLRQFVLQMAYDKYKTKPERLWKRYPLYEVLRHEENRKWYAVVMEIDKEKLGIEEDGRVDILVVKADPDMAAVFLSKAGFYPGYHMNKNSWITLLLDGTVSENEITLFLETSYEITKGKKKRQAVVGNRDWLIPANPKYYDIEPMIENSEDGTFIWKQSSNINVGDMIYLYVASPVSAVRYQCKAVEVDIPYTYEDKNIRINRAMRLKLIDRLDKENINMELLKEFGVYSIRGPRSVPNSLIQEIAHRKKM